MTRKRLAPLAALVALATALLGPSLVGLGDADARRPSASQRHSQLRDTVELELELSRAANAIARGQAALEREHESLTWSASLLTRQGRESLRKLDIYRGEGAERSALGEARARKLYKLARGGGMLELMFEDGADGRVSPHQRVGRGRALRRLVDRDLELLAVHADAEAKAREELLAATRELSVVAALESVARLQADALALSEAALDPALDSVHERRQSLERTVNKSRAERALVAAVKRERRDLARHRGLDMLEDDALERPVRGRIVGKFGTYEDRALGVDMHRNGVELRAAPADPVRAIAPGTVALVGALPGFERVVVIDHGGGYLSLTARLLSVEVEEGQEIEAGTRLGRVGPKSVDDGLGTSVYVEIRHGQRPIDPSPYLGSGRAGARKSRL